MNPVPQIGQKYSAIEAAYTHTATVLDVFAHAPYGVLIVYSRNDINDKIFGNFPFVNFLDTFLLSYIPAKEKTCDPQPSVNSYSKTSSQWGPSWFIALRARWNHAILFFKQPW